MTSWGQQAAEESGALAAALESKRAINLARIGQNQRMAAPDSPRLRRGARAAEQALAVATGFSIDWAVVNLSIHKGLAMAHLSPNAAEQEEAVAIVKRTWGIGAPEGRRRWSRIFWASSPKPINGREKNGALDLVDQAIELGDQIDEHFHDAELYRIRGEARLSGER